MLAAGGAGGIMRNRTDQTLDCPGEQCADVIARLEAALGGPLDAPYDWHVVRNVAPSKHHVCISFRVPEAVAFAAQSQDSTAQLAPGHGAGASARKEAVVAEEHHLDASGETGKCARDEAPRGDGARDRQGKRRRVAAT